MNSALPSSPTLRPDRKTPPPFDRGTYYEAVVCDWLKKEHGYRILNRNFRAGRAEIDIVAKKGNTVVFVEVKARREGSVYHPLRSVDPRKAAALRFASCAWLRQLKSTGVDPEEIEIRYDVVCVVFAGDGAVLSVARYPSYLEPDRENFRSSL